MHVDHTRVLLDENSAEPPERIYLKIELVSQEVMMYHSLCLKMASFSKARLLLLFGRIADAAHDPLRMYPLAVYDISVRSSALRWPLSRL